MHVCVCLTSKGLYIDILPLEVNPTKILLLVKDITKVQICIIIGISFKYPKRFHKP